MILYHAPTHGERPMVPKKSLPMVLFERLFLWSNLNTP